MSKKDKPKAKKAKPKKEKPATKKKGKAVKEEEELEAEVGENVTQPESPTRLESELVNGEDERAGAPKETKSELVEVEKPDEGVQEEAITEEAPAEEVEKPAEEEEEGLEIVEEKFYDLNLRRIWNSPREKRTPRAVRFIREFVSKRMKSDEVSISEETNHILWARGISKPPRHLRLRVIKDKDDRVIIFPAEPVAKTPGPKIER
ncbi:MAG TPA: 50S ribosomal protein L31e, partial [Candidatus Binatus sp.]|nr:50S ribosomal protein L31e [Candidatus Binatus sp.]